MKKKEALEKKKTTKHLMLLYGLAGIAILVLIAIVVAWLNNPFPTPLRFTY